MAIDLVLLGDRSIDTPAIRHRTPAAGNAAISSDLEPRSATASGRRVVAEVAGAPSRRSAVSFRLPFRFVWTTFRKTQAHTMRTSRRPTTHAQTQTCGEHVKQKITENGRQKT